MCWGINDIMYAREHGIRQVVFYRIKEALWKKMDNLTDDDRLELIRRFSIFKCQMQNTAYLDKSPFLVIDRELYVFIEKFDRWAEILDARMEAMNLFLLESEPTAG